MMTMGKMLVTHSKKAVYTPSYSAVDLVCGTQPSKYDSSVIFCAEAAFTGELKPFDHSNIAGDHVSKGKKYYR